MEKATGHVEAVEERVDYQLVLVRLQDGSTNAVSAPAMILIEVGMKVEIEDFGDGKPTYK